jgi:hypothetical protein
MNKKRSVAFFLVGIAALAGTAGTASAQSLTIGGVSQAEGNNGNTDYIFTITLSPAHTLQVDVDWTALDNSATTADNDYIADSGTVTFLPGETA